MRDDGVYDLCCRIVRDYDRRVKEHQATVTRLYPRTGNVIALPIDRNHEEASAPCDRPEA